MNNENKDENNIASPVVSGVDQIPQESPPVEAYENLTSANQVTDGLPNILEVTEDVAVKADVVNTNTEFPKPSQDDSQNSKSESAINPVSKKKRAFNIAKISLIVIAIGVALYLIIAPLLPMVEYYVRDWLDIPYDKSIVKLITGSDQFGSLEIDGKDGNQQSDDSNKIVISKIGVNMPIIVGSTDKALDEGSWIRPNGSTPDKGGNTILTAHRFNYIGGDRSFYNLDKIEKGDKIEVEWKDATYTYIVTKSFIVDPSQVEVEANTAKPQLTVYTCTPLWTAAKRLIVVAEPDEATLELINSN
jgi:sortase A